MGVSFCQGFSFLSLIVLVWECLKDSERSSAMTFSQTMLFDRKALLTLGFLIKHNVLASMVVEKRG